MLHRRLTAAITLAVVLSLSLAAPGTALPQGSAQPAASVSRAVPAVTQVADTAPLARARKMKKADKKKWRRNYKPSGGVTFNSALGKRRVQNRINKKLLTLIDASRSGTRIRIMSWNVMYRASVKAQLKAQRRGAIIKVLMAEENAAAIENDVWQELVDGIAANNVNQKPHRQSWA